MTNLMDTSINNDLNANSTLTKPKLPLNQQDQNSQDLPKTVETLKEKMRKNNVAKFILNKEQEDFVQRLVEFHRHRNVNTPLSYWPTLNGKSIDLYKLYMKVLSLGGWERVCEKNKWDDIWEDFEPELDLKACFNGSHALKLVYVRYLSLYEKFEAHMNGLGEQPSGQNLTHALNSSTSFFLAHSKLTADAERAGAADESTLGIINRRRFSYLFDTVPMNYNSNQHTITSYSVSNNDHTDMDTGESVVQHQLCRLNYNPYEKLEQSLISGLPNELDFAFNTIMLLSGDEYHGFKVYSSPRMIDLMLAHIGYFGVRSSHNYRELYDKIWHPPTGLAEENQNDFDRPESMKLKRRNYVKFWHNAVKLPEDENKSLISELLPRMYNEYLNTLPEQDLLNLRDDSLHQNSQNASSVEYRRIEQVMITLNNLSFEENNAEFMANKSSALFEFLIMCLFCSNSECYIELKKHALDILTNISRKIKINRMSENHKCLLLVSIDYLLNGQYGHRNLPNPHFEGNNNGSEVSQSQDQFDIIRGLEVLTKLCSQKIDPNETEDYQNEVIISTSQVIRSVNNGVETYKLQSIDPMILHDSIETMPESNSKRSQLFLNKILYRLEHLLSLQDLFVLLHSLECLYNMSQYSENICNMIVSYQSVANSFPRLVPMLVNLLTIDMTHFGMSINSSDISKKQSNGQVNNQPVPMKMYKVIPTNTIIAANNTANSQTQNPQNSMTANAAQTGKTSASQTLLQQTLHNQHLTNNVNSTKMTSNIQNHINSPNANNKIPSNQEQIAKNVLCNWLRTCFQVDSSSEISKTKLYPYYQQIAKINNWSVLTIPTFFEILNATFPNLRYNDNQITGIKLVVNIKQQLQMKKDDLIKESSETWTSQAANVKCTTKTLSPSKNIGSSSLNATKIKYLLNPSSIPQSQNNQTQKVIANTANSESKSVAQIFSNQENLAQKTPDDNQLKNILPKILPAPPLTITSDLPSGPLTPILTPPTPKIENKDGQVINKVNTEVKSQEEFAQTHPDFEMKEEDEEEKINLSKASNGYAHSQTDQKADLNIKTNEQLNGQLDMLKDTVGKKVKENSQSKPLDKPLNGLLNLTADLENRNKSNFNTNIKSATECSESSQSSSENDEISETILNSNKENNEDFTKKRKHEPDTGSGDAPEHTANQKSENLNKKINTSTQNVPAVSENTVTQAKQTTLVPCQENTTPVINNSTPSVSQEIPTQTGQNSATIQVQVPVQAAPPSAPHPVVNPIENTNPTQPSNSIIPNVNYQNVINSQQGPAVQVNTVNPGTSGDYLCEWNQCKSQFHTSTQIYNHVCNYHLLNTGIQFTNGQLCLWSGCDQIKRQKWSLINHLQEKHCNENALKIALMNRQRGIISTPSASLNSSIINTKDAALIAIQRHQKKNMEEFWRANEEGPLTRSIRLLSALTLRNLSKNSEKAKACIRPYENTLADIAFDLMESSNAIANCLWNLSN